jgi:cell division transport system permease protein
MRPLSGFLTLLACILSGTLLALTVYVVDLARTATLVPVSASSMMVFIKGRPSAEAIERLGRDLASLPGIERIVFIPRAEGLKRMRQWLGSDNPLVADLEADLLPDAFEVRLDKRHLDGAQALAGRIRLLAQVEDVRYNQGLMGHLAGSYHGIRMAGVIFAAALSMCLGLIIFLTMRVSLEGRRHELEILSLLGADRLFLYSPHIVESLGLCIIGAVLGCLLAGYSVEALRTHISILGQVMGAFTLRQAGVVLGVCILLSLTGAGLALRR